MLLPSPHILRAWGGLGAAQTPVKAQPELWPEGSPAGTMHSRLSSPRAHRHWS